MDLGSTNARTRLRRSKNVYDEDSDSETQETDGGRGPGRDHDMQVILKGKEDILVERALERIARAQALGKTSVELSQAEIDALERLERKQQRPATPPVPKVAPKNKKAIQTRPKQAERKKSKGEKAASNSPKVKTIEAARSNRGRSSTASRESALVPYPVLPEQGFPQAGMYDHDGYYMPAPIRPPGPSSRPDSRTASSHSLRQQHSHTPPVPLALQPYYQGRFYSNPDVHYARPSSNSSRASRPDPSDPDWEPRARSTSNLVSYPVDQPPYQTQMSRVPRFDPSDVRFASPTARRVVSGPAAVHTQQQKPRQHVQEDTKPSTTSEDDDEDDDDDDDEHGVQVNADVTDSADGEYRMQTRSLAVTDARSRARGGGRSKTGKRGR